MTYSFLIAIAAVVAIVCIILYYNNKLSAIKNENAKIIASLEYASKETKKLESKLASTESILAQKDNLSQKLSKECAILEERIKNQEASEKTMKEEMDNRFKVIADRILNDKAKVFKEANESRLLEILNPFKDNIEQFKKTINDNYIAETKERITLQAHIKDLVALNQSIGKDAKELSQALRGNSKVQGDWGEMILENILEKSGLVKDEEYKLQLSTDNGKKLTNEDGRLQRPDVVIYMPDQKKMIVDSKVSITAYVNYINADDTESQKEFLKQHIASVKSHINELKTKKYQDTVNDAGDFVMMFIPNEGAYLAAMQGDSTLWQYAYDNRVVILSPTHLISALKLIVQLWRHDKQTKNAEAIAKEGGKLYDKFAGFVSDMEKIAKCLNSTQNAYDDAINKLNNGKDNLIRKVERLKAMGCKVTKQLPGSQDE